MCEVEVCPECGSPSVLDDNEHGEIVCRDCGLVLGISEFMPPQENTTTTTNMSTNPLAFTSSAVGIENSAQQRTERQISYDINRAIQKLDLPHNIEGHAILHARKILRKAKQNNPNKIRLTCKEVAIAAIWEQLKQTKYPLSANEYAQKLGSIYKQVNLMKIQKRVGYFVQNKNRLTDPTLIKKHINKITTKLTNAHFIDGTYANILTLYAIQIVHVNLGVATNRRANLLAAAVLLAADQLLANRLRLQVLAQVSSTGTGNLSTIAKIYKKHAPPLPKECAALQFTYYLQKEVSLC